MNWQDFIKPELAALPFVLCALGAALKKAQRFADNLIPLVLGVCGVGLSALWVLATSPIAGWQNALLAVFTAVVQGVLCAAAAVYGNQMVKQAGKTKDL